MTARVTVNLPDDLAGWLVIQATQNRRSLSNQIVWMLEQARTAETEDEQS